MSRKAADYFKSHVRRWVFPTMATVAFLLLLMHKSEFPEVFARYSIDYAILLIVFGINLGLSWRLSFLRVSYGQLMKQFSGRPLISIAILVLSVAFVIDFVAGLPRPPSDWVNLGLLMGILIQVEGLRKESGQLSAHLALWACSVALGVILLEMIFVFFLLESKQPRNEGEFLRVMTSNAIQKGNAAWPEPISVAKLPGVFRIIGLSDSFGLAGGTISNYHYLLERTLRRDVSPTIQMVNISVGGYDPLEELNILRRFGIAYSPDLVLHGFFVGNDFNLYTHNTDSYTYLFIPATRDPRRFRYRPRHFLSRSWVVNALKLLQERRSRQSEITRGVVDRVGNFSKGAYLKIQFERMSVWAKRTEKDIDRMKKVFPVLDAIRSTAEGAGARYVMVIHPDETQVNDELRQDILNTFQLNEDNYDFALPQRLLRSYCADRGIPCLDLLPAFLSKSKYGELYILRDTHYNPSGNEVAAKSIRQFLHERQLLAEIPPLTSGRGN